MKRFSRIVNEALQSLQFANSALPIFLVCLSGAVYSVLAFFPGWMSPDSYGQYSDAKEGVYGDWHPVLMAWWWAKLDSIYAGPAPMLLQNILLYWGAWGVLAYGAWRWIGRFAIVIPLLAFWPGILFPLGQIWKDVFFACSMFFAWALVLNICAQERRPFWLERLAILVLATFSFGVKTNGLTALPFLLYFWVHLEGGRFKRLFGRLMLSIGLSAVVVALAVIVVPSKQIVKTSPFQYTQSYDLLAISVRTGDVVLPRYITNRTGTDLDRLKKLYWIGGNDVLFYRTYGNLRTTDSQELGELGRSWRHAIFKYPFVYLSHRWDNFLELTRIGADRAAYVASPLIVDNPWGFSFQMNRFAEWLSSQPERRPAMFFPWVYIFASILAMLILLALKFQIALAIAIGGSVVFFILPHFFVAPAADYRYLYYSYFCAMTLVVLALAAIVQMFVKWETHGKS